MFYSDSFKPEYYCHSIPENTAKLAYKGKISRNKLGKISFYKIGKELKVLGLLACVFLVFVCLFFNIYSKITALSNETLS